MKETYHPEAKKQKTAKRRVDCISGIHIDANDYFVLKRIFRGKSLPDMLKETVRIHRDNVPREHGNPLDLPQQSTGILSKVLKVGGENEGFRIRELRITEHKNKRLRHAIEDLDHLEILHINLSLLDEYPEWIRRLSRLKELYIVCDSNQSTQVPDAIGSLSNLERFSASKSPKDYSNRSVLTIPSAVGNLRNLKFLALDRNIQLAGLPNNIYDLWKLEELRINSSNTSLFPYDVGRWSNLTSLEIYDSDELTFLPSILDLKSLTHLCIDEQSFGRLPDQISRLVNLEVLHILESDLKWLPPSLCNLSKLKVLNLAYNEDLEYLPENIGNLTNLEVLCLDGTAVKFFPASICDLRVLKALYLPWSINSSAILDHLSQLKSLEFLDISYIYQLQHSPELGSLAAVCSRLLAILPNMTKLKAINLSEEFACCVDSISILSTVLQRCPNLACLGEEFSYKLCEPDQRNEDDPTYLDFNDSLLQNQVRSMNSFIRPLVACPSFKPSLWARVLSATRYEDIHRERFCRDRVCNCERACLYMDYIDGNFIFQNLVDHSTNIFQRGHN